VRELVVRLATDNPGWGYTRIRDVMWHLGRQISRTTVRRILKADGIEPAPQRLKHMPLGGVPEGPLGCHRSHRLLPSGGAD
jgi:hypothetical protein